MEIVMRLWNMRGQRLFSGRMFSIWVKFLNSIQCFKTSVRFSSNLVVELLQFGFKQKSLASLIYHNITASDSFFLRRWAVLLYDLMTTMKFCIYEVWSKNNCYFQISWVTYVRFLYFFFSVTLVHMSVLRGLPFILRD